MQLDVTSSLPRGAARKVAFLLESSDPAAGAPREVRAALARACRAAGFRGTEKETVSSDAPGRAVDPRGPRRVSRFRWPASPRRPARRPRSGPSGTGGAPLPLRKGARGTGDPSVLPQLAALDYRFDRYRSRASSGAGRGRKAGRILVGRVDAASPGARRPRGVVVSRGGGLGAGPRQHAGQRPRSRRVRRRRSRRWPARIAISVRVFDKKAIERERLAGLLAVNSGSVRPPRFVIGDYRPARARGTAVLVGKGITFDSGGISIKPSPSMGEMKYDMMGAATVFAALQAARAAASARARRRARARDREPAVRLRLPAGRHPPDAQREDRRGGQHRRRGPPRARRRRSTTSERYRPDV